MTKLFLPASLLPCVVPVFVGKAARTVVLAAVVGAALPAAAQTPKRGEPEENAIASYHVKVEAPPARKGDKSVARIRITPGAGFHINKEYPTSVTVQSPSGVTLDKPKLGAKDATRWEEAGAEFEVAFTAASAGAKTFTGELKFAVCSPTTCDPKKEKLSFVVDVK